MSTFKFVAYLLLFTFITPVFSEDIEEIVVTALKRSSTIVDTPASITAIGANEIDDKGITDMNDLKHLAFKLFCFANGMEISKGIVAAREWLGQCN